MSMNESGEKENKIKQLNAENAAGGKISVLSGNIRKLKAEVESLLGRVRERERRRQEKLKAEEEARARAEAKAEKAAPSAADEPVKEAEKAAPSEKSAEPVAAPEKAAESVVAAEPKVQRPASSDAEKKAKTTVTKSDVVTRTRSFVSTDHNAMPSYIKGRITPPPVVSRPLHDAKGPARVPGKTAKPLGPRPAASAARPLPKIDLPAPSKDRKGFDGKRKEHTKSEDKKTMNKRTLIRKGFIPQDLDEERMGTRKLKNKRAKEPVVFTPVKIEKAVITTENLTVKILSEKIGKTAQEIIKQLMILGIVTNINSVVDFPTMELVANELGVKLELKLDKSMEERLEAEYDEADDEKDLVKRPPVITVMGHVDHGKTSLLDFIRSTNVAGGEAGGITQHIGAYSVTVKGEKITFLDTPGHEAFTQMRARGAQVTDIAVLIVAVDDGVKPQTIEAINHAKAAHVPVIVAINKIDKPGANPEKIKQSLTEYGLVPDEWGGDTMMVPVSAKTGEGVDKLLETILFLAEYNGYKANPNRKAKGTIIEAKLDKGKGPVANIIVQNGTLRVGDFVVSGVSGGRVRAMVDDKGRNIKEAGPSTPVSVLGFDEVPSAGDAVFAVEDEKTGRQVIAERQAKIQTEKIDEGQKVTIDDVFNKIRESKIKEFNVVLKADVQGSVEALRNSLVNLSNDEVKVTVIHAGVGAINRSDMMIAEVSHAMVVGFNVRPDAESKALAESSGITVRLYRIIYEAIEDIEKAMKGLLEPRYEEKIVGRAQIRSVFRTSKAGAIAGSYVTNGKIIRGAKYRLFRGSDKIAEGTIVSVKHFKDDVKEIAAGFECGINLGDFSDLCENDEIECYVLEEIK